MQLIRAVCLSFFMWAGHCFSSPTVAIHAVMFDGSSVNAADLPDIVLVGADEIMSGSLTKGPRHLRALSVQSSDGDTCPFFDATKRLKHLFTSTCSIANPTPQTVDLWIPTNKSKAKLAIKLESANHARLAFSADLKETGVETLHWEFGNLSAGSFVTFAFAATAKGPTPAGRRQACNLSDVVFLIIDYR